MIDVRNDPTRRCMPLAEWPVHHRHAWEDAVRSGSPFRDMGPATHWRQGTRNKVASSYGRWLTFLHCKGVLEPSSEPADYLVPELLRGYALELQNQVAPITLAQRFTDLDEGIRVMSPAADRRALNRAARALTVRAKPSRDKRAAYVPPRKILEVGLAMIAEATGSAGDEVSEALRHRNGLMLTILAARAPRRRNFCAIEIGANLERIGEEYVLRFSGAETKNGRPWEATLPATLKPAIERYIDHFRPILLNGRDSRRLWIARNGTDMVEGSIYGTVRQVTKNRLGVALNLHSFRNGPATALSIEDPEHVWAASPINGHADLRTTERYYNLATGVDARRQYQDHIRKLRREGSGVRTTFRRRSLPHQS